MESPFLVVHFGAFEVDLRSRELRKRGLKIKLQDQPFQVLAILLEHAGEMVARDELRQRLLPADTFVDFDHGLNNAINRLREALCDSAGKPLFIETLPRRGYRFIAPIALERPVSTGSLDQGSASSPVIKESSVRDGLKAASADESSQRSKDVGVRPCEYPPDVNLISADRLSASGKKALPVLVVAAVLLTGAAIGSFTWQRVRVTSGSPGTYSIRSLAVLPLANLSGDAEQEYLVDGITDQLITDLAKIGSLRVISRTSVMRYKEARNVLPQIAKELNVDAVVEGTVQRSGNRVRITAQLIRAAPEQHLWAQSYERDLRDLLSLQGEVARSIADEIQIKLSPLERTLLNRNSPANPETYEMYLKGFHFANKRTEAGLKKGLDYFQQAVDTDPAYALAYAGLANAYDVLGGFSLLPAREAFPKAQAAAIKALALDNSLADAHAALGFAILSFDWNWAAAATERGVESGANLARKFKLVTFEISNMQRA